MIWLLDILKNTKFSFNNPRKTDVLIWDSMNNDILSRYTLYDIDHGILPVRGEIVFLSPQIIKNSLKILLNLFFKRLLKSEEMSDFGLMRVYSLACIQYINPKVVITFIDNNPTFYWLANTFLKATFYAVQNGNRIYNTTLEYFHDNIGYPPYDLETDTFSVRQILKITKETRLVVFGEHEIAFYRKYNPDIGLCYAIGSLKGSFYRYIFLKETPKIEYDLCLVSVYRRSGVDNSFRYKNDLETTVNYVYQFIQETGSSLCIALANEGLQEEYDFYRKKFGNNVTLIENNKKKFSVYEAMCKSKVIVSDSTALIEAFGWGKKVLFCHNTCDPYADHTFSDICTANDVDYNCFKNKLMYLFELDEAIYIDMTRDAQKYMMNYDPDMPATIFLRNLILKDLA